MGKKVPTRKHEQQSASAPPPPWRDRLLVAVGLAVLTLVVFWPALSGEFLSLDDEVYVVNNEMVHALTLENFLETFTSFHALAWNPLTWISHMIDTAIWGLNPWGHHLSALLLHTLSTLLLFYLLDRATGRLWLSAMVAALFAIHPLHVESVAWISERKDVLSTFFMFAAIAAYLDFVRAPSPARYGLVTIALILGLLSKPMLVSLPFVLLLFDFWPLNRLSPRAVVEKLPWFALAFGVAIVTVLAQKPGEAETALADIPLLYRVGNAIQSTALYLGQMLWPAKLSPFYPHPALHGDPLVAWQVGLCLLALLLITAGCLVLWRSHPYLLFGWLWYLVTLAPVSGVIQIGSHGRADRYTYVPLAGIFIGLVWLAGGFAEGLRKRPWGGPFGRLAPTQIALGGAAALILIACAVRTRLQLPVWQDSMAVWSAIVRHYPDHPRGLQGLGMELNRAGRHEEALKALQGGLSGSAFVDAEVYRQMGLAAYRLGRRPEAANYYTRAAKLDPGDLISRVSLAILYFEMGNGPAAEAACKAVFALNPDDWEAHEVMAKLCENGGRYTEAIEHHRRILAQDPGYAESIAAIERLRAKIAGGS